MRKYHLLMVFFAIVQCAIAQDTITIKGYVRDSVTKEPLPGALVQIEGTRYYSHVDLDGRYMILIRDTLPKYGIIKATMMGYIGKQKQCKFNELTRNNFYLCEDPELVKHEKPRFQNSRPENRIRIMNAKDILSLPGSIGDIKGKIVDRNTGSAISNAMVIIGREKLHHLSDSLGCFSFTRIIAGHYPLIVIKKGYYSPDTIIIKVFPDSTIEEHILLTPLPDSAKP